MYSSLLMGNLTAEATPASPPLLIVNWESFISGEMIAAVVRSPLGGALMKEVDENSRLIGGKVERTHSRIIILAASSP